MHVIGFIIIGFLAGIVAKLLTPGRVIPAASS